MWPFIVKWCQSWRRRDVLMTLLASLVMVGGMAALADEGAWVLAPILTGVALLWRTPLTQYPFDLGPDEPKPFVQPWERDAQRRARGQARKRR